MLEPASPLFLIGYRGSGKSTIAKLLAARLGWDWVDADDEIERQAGLSIREIFAQFGEPAFRDRETDVVRCLADRRRTIVALGGGAILRKENRDVISARGRTVWLQASPESLWRRLQSDDSTAARRPNLTAAGGYEEICRLLAFREPFYQECASWSVDTEGKSPEAVCEAIWHWLSTNS